MTDHDSTTENIALILSALGHEIRLEVFHMLIESGAIGCNVSELAKRVQVPPTTMSFHLSQLRRAGLVSFRHVARGYRTYTAIVPTLEVLMTWLGKTAQIARAV